MNPSLPDRRRLLAWAAILAVALAVRAMPLRAARPYIAYVDEGNYLHSAFQILRTGDWDPHAYLYPSLPIRGAALAMRVANRVSWTLNGRSLLAEVPPSIELYEDLEPFEFLLVGRVLCLALGLAIVAMTGMLATRLAGPIAGLAAALLAALAPALVLRSSIATVDPWATAFVLSALLLTEISRTSRRPGLASFAAGAMAGFAFASKYPTVLVIVAFAVTTFLASLPLREKLRRLALAAAGLVLAAVVGMPALVTHTRGVFDAIREQGRAYGVIPSDTLWRQAFVRAEWDLHYERPELGVAFTLFAVGGLILGLRQRRIAPTIWGWCALIAVSLALYGTRVFQPFRNLLPLVPPACVAVSLLFVALRERLRPAALVSLGGLLWVLVSFGAPLVLYGRERARLVDSRVAAVDWVIAHARPEDKVLVVRELGILKQEIRRVPVPIGVVWSIRIAEAISTIRPRFVVAGALERADADSADARALQEVKDFYEVRFETGTRPTRASPSEWRDNDQIVYVLERKG